MTQDDGGYDLKPEEKKPPAPSPLPNPADSAKPKPGDPDWVEPVPVIEKASVDEEPPPPPADPDIEKHKGAAIAAYILFLIPLVVAPNSPYARYHANQGLLVFILWWVAIIGNVVLWGLIELVGRIPEKLAVLDYFFSCLFHVLQPALLLGVLALVVYGIIHAANGEKRPLPLVGNWSLIK